MTGLCGRSDPCGLGLIRRFRACEEHRRRFQRHEINGAHQSDKVRRPPVAMYSFISPRAGTFRRRSERHANGHRNKTLYSRGVAVAVESTWVRHAALCGIKWIRAVRWTPPLSTAVCEALMSRWANRRLQGQALRQLDFQAGGPEWNQHLYVARSSLTTRSARPRGTARFYNRRANSRRGRVQHVWTSDHPSLSRLLLPRMGTCPPEPSCPQRGRVVPFSARWFRRRRLDSTCAVDNPASPRYLPPRG